MPAKGRGLILGSGFVGLRRAPLALSFNASSALAEPVVPPPSAPVFSARQARLRARPRGKNTELPDPDRFAEGAVPVGQAECRVREPDTGRNPTGRCSLPSRRRANMWPPTGQRPAHLDDAPLGSTRAKKGRGRAVSPTVGGRRSAALAASCPYVSRASWALVGANRPLAIRRRPLESAIGQRDFDVR